MNRRTIQQSYSSGTLTETRHSYYTTPGQWQVIEERVDAATVAERQFMWGVRYVDDLVLRDRDTNGDETLDKRLYALQDANWNVTAITNSSGLVQERYAYSPYGVPELLTSTFGSRSSSSFDWRYLFTGRRLDTETGLYDFRHRPLSSRLGTFLTRDPLGFPDGPNSYAAWFVPNNNDPFGTDLWWSYESADGKVCGYDIWLLTGSWCADPSLVLAATDAHDKYTNCWFDCEQTTHTNVITYIGGVAAGTNAWVQVERVRWIAKTPAELATRLGGGNIQKSTSILSRIANMADSKLLRYHMRYTKTAPIKSLGRTCVAGIAIIETVIAWTCAWKCSS